MTTPADNTPIAIITDAMMDAGLLQDGEDPTPEQLAKNMRRLRDMINLWQTQGLKLWLLSDTAVPITATKAVYSFKPAGDVNMTRPLRAIQGYFLYTTTGVQRPLISLSWQEFLNLGQTGTTNTGTINSYFVNKLADQMQVTFWLCPDATEVTNGQPHVLIQTQATNPVTLNETTVFPPEWRMALHWGLADDICTGQPQSVINRCAQKAQLFRTMLEDWDVEDTQTQFTPDPRMVAGGSRFR